jgi:hypothetical protein
MEPESFNWMDIVLKVFAASGVAAMLASFLTNARGKNKFLDFVMDIIEAVGWNINKAENKPDA